MSEAASTIKTRMQSDSAPSDDGSSKSSNKAVDKSSQASGESPGAGAEGASPVVQPETVDSPNDNVKNSNDVLIEPLVTLFREFLEAMSHPPSDHSKQNTETLRKKLFGLTKGLSPTDTRSNDRFDYEQKYPRDRRGEELADNARVWLTYLDEADTYDREKVEGWKETVDVLLVFAGLFSGVITTFVSQASQSLQRDHTQVSASLLFQIAQVQMAQFTGKPLTDFPNSPLTPNSPFRPSTNAFLVNGLWFTSLAISLSTALVAVLTRQWLYYYMSAISGSALEKVRVRHFRFRGLEFWKVALIVDLLPILLHLALGVFLVGVIIFLFPLDTRITWAIVTITGITYTLYFISVILPIRYPECPYTTSLTVYVGSVFYFLREIGRRLNLIFARIPHLKALSRMKFFYPTKRFIQYLFDLVRWAFFALVQPIRRIFSNPGMPVFPEGSSRFLNWREKSLNKAIRKGGMFLDFTALSWLYTISSNQSVRRIIARGLFAHPVPFYKFMGFNSELEEMLQVDESRLTDLCYALSLDVQQHGGDWDHWRLLWSISDVEGSQLEELEYQNYRRVSEDVINGNHVQVLKDGLYDRNLKLPLIMWDCLLLEAARDDTLAGHILASGQINPFDWSSNSLLGKSTYDTGVVPFGTKEQYKWIFIYLFRCFCDDADPNYSLDRRSFEKGYLLLVSFYRNLTSEQPIIADEEQRGRSLEFLFENFRSSFYLRHPYKASKPLHTSPEQFLAFQEDILCTNAFWDKPMTNKARKLAVTCLNKIWSLCSDFDTTARLPAMGWQDLSPIYIWHSKDFSNDSVSISPTILLLFTPQNRGSLLRLLSADSSSISHFSTCLKNLRYYRNKRITREYICPSLMEAFKSVGPTAPSFWTLYNPSVLIQVWKLLAVVDRLDKSHFFSILSSKLRLPRLENIHADMTKEAQTERDKYAGNSDELQSMVGLESDEVCKEYLDALHASLDEFKRIISVTRSGLASELDPATMPVGGRDLEASPEEPNDKREGSYSMTHWMKQAFISVWRKLFVK